MYHHIPWWKFAAGAVIVALPLLVMPESGGWRWKYVLLILVMFSLLNSNGLRSFYGFVNSELRSKK